MKNDDLGGIAEPLTFTKGQNNVQRICYWINEIQGGTYISPNSSQRTCL
jgi:hypothetical protein